MRKLLLLFMFCTTILNAQNPQWLNYNTSNSGLASNSVGSIVIDAQGNKWFCSGLYSPGGVSKFDGINWTTYNTSNSGLAGNYGSCIAIDKGGNKWFGVGTAGLSRFDGVNWTTYNTSNSGLVGSYVSSIVIDANDNKWIGNGGAGVSKFDGINWITYNTSNSGLGGNYIRSIVIDASGNKWFIYDGIGVSKFDGVNWITYNTSNFGLPYTQITSVAAEANGSIWFGTGNGKIVKLNGNSWITYDNSKTGIPDTTIMSIAIDTKGNKWFGTQLGVVKFDDANWTIYKPTNSGLNGEVVSSIAIDAYGNKWFGGFYGFSGISELLDTIASGSIPLVTVSTTNVLCNGKNNGAATANVTGGTAPYTYLWNSLPVQTVATATNLSAGTYTIKVTDANGISITATVTITQTNGVIANAGLNQTVYYGYSPSSCAILKGTASGGVAPYQYGWSTGATTSCVKVCPSTGQQYTLTIKDQNGCTAKDVVKVCVVDVKCGTSRSCHSSESKIEICHKSGNKTQTLCVDASAVPAHLAHGDHLGACGEPSSCYDVAKTGEGEDNLIVIGEINLVSYPNPFTEETTIRFNSVETEQIEVSVFNVLGVKVATIFNGTVNGLEIHEEKFNAESLSNGIYFIKLITEQGDMKVERVVLNR